MGTKTRHMRRDEFERFLAVILDPPEHLLPYAALAAFICGSGARFCEAVRLTVDDLIDEDGRPRESVSRILAKQRSETRISAVFPWDRLGAPILRFIEQSRRRFMVGRGELLFSLRWSNQPISNGHANKMNRKLLRLAGLPTKGIAFHGQRKTFLGNVYYSAKEEGGDHWIAMELVRKLAGHKDINTTLKYMWSVVVVDEKEIINDAFGKLNFAQARKGELETIRNRGQNDQKQRD